MDDKQPMPIITIIGRVKPIRVLLEIKNQNNAYCSSICRAVDITYSHGTKLIRMFEKAGLLTSKHTGRSRWVKLTEIGTKVANSIETMLYDTGDAKFLYQITSFKPKWKQQRPKREAQKVSPKPKLSSKE